MGPLGLTLLLSLSACSPPVQTTRSLGNDVTIRVESPHAKVRYPDSVRVRVTIRNSGTRPFTMTWPPSFRADRGCNGSAQRDPVELWFNGSTYEKSFESKPYAWHWSPPSPQPAQLVIAPQQSRVVIDAEFDPPPRVYALQGGFCVRVYGYDMPGGARYQGPRR